MWGFLRSERKLVNGDVCRVYKRKDLNRSMAKKSV